MGYGMWILFEVDNFVMVFLVIVSCCGMVYMVRFDIMYLYILMSYVIVF